MFNPSLIPCAQPLALSHLQLLHDGVGAVGGADVLARHILRQSGNKRRYRVQEVTLQGEGVLTIGSEYCPGSSGCETLCVATASAEALPLFSEPSLPPCCWCGRSGELSTPPASATELSALAPMRASATMSRDERVTVGFSFLPLPL